MEPGLAGSAVARQYHRNKPAERKCGELLRDMDKAQGRRTDLPPNLVESDNQVKTLSEMGVTKDQSSKWQKLADVPEDVFESVINNRGMPVSGTQVLATADPQTEEKKEPHTTTIHQARNSV